MQEIDYKIAEIYKDMLSKPNSYRPYIKRSLKSNLAGNDAYCITVDVVDDYYNRSSWCYILRPKDKHE